MGKVDLVGATRREVNVLLDPARLEALSLGVNEVFDGLRSENVDTPLGRLTRAEGEYPLRLSGKPGEVEKFRSLSIAVRNGRPIALGEVGRIVDGIEEPRSLSLVNGVPAITLDIIKQSGANEVAVVDMGLTLNIMTLMALSLSIGLLIDDAIVVRENIVRHLERGKDHFDAARSATSEIGLAVFATTLSIVAVFVPVAFMRGIVGRFFLHFGITVAFAVLVSLLVSFTLDPMLSSRWHDPVIALKGRRRGLANLLDRFNSWFDRCADRYQNAIAWGLDHRKTVVVLAILSFCRRGGSE